MATFTNYRAMLLLSISISSLLLSASAQSPSPAPAESPSESLDVGGLTIVKFESKSLASEKQAVKFVETNMIGTMHKIEMFIDDIKKRLNDPSSSEIDNEGLQQCKEVYEAAIDDAKNILDDLSENDMYKANVDLSAVSTNVDTCEEEFSQLVGDDANLKKFGEWVRGMTGDCLDALQKFNS